MSNQLKKQSVLQQIQTVARSRELQGGGSIQLNLGAVPEAEEVVDAAEDVQDVRVDAEVAHPHLNFSHVYF